MNYDLQKRLDSLEGMIKIQTDCLEAGYMHGMLNGLKCAHSIFADCNPRYVKMVRKKTKVRHKLKKYGKVRSKR